MKQYGMKRKRIRSVACILIGCMILGLLSGCTKEKKDNNTLTLMFPTENRYDEVAGLIDNLRDTFPEIDFEIEYIEGGDPALYQVERLQNEDAPDIVWYNGPMSEDIAKERLVDLSGESFIGNFDDAILSHYDVDGSIYQVPGPVAALSIVVNKTLLQEVGADVPNNFDELVEDIKLIRQKYPDIAPVSVGMTFMDNTFRMLGIMNQCGYLSTPSGYAWKEAYQKGDASIAEGFSEGLEMFGRLIDAGAFDVEMNQSMWDMIADVELQRKVAMSTSLLYPRQVTWVFQPNPDFKMDYQDEFELLPFFGSEDGQKGLCLLSHSAWGINKKLEEKGNETKLQNALKVMEYLSTNEGQNALSPNETYIPSLRTIDNDNRPDYVKELWEKSAQGHQFFAINSGYEDIEEACVNILWDAMKSGSSEGMKEKFIETADRIHSETVRKESTSDTLGMISEKIPGEQTLELYRKAIHEASGADMTLVTTSGFRDGARNCYGLSPVNLYPGKINRAIVNTGIAFWPSRIQTVSLTGAEIETLLKEGKTIHEVPFAYSAEGLDVTYNQDNEVTDITWNHKELEANRQYTVAFISSDYTSDFSKSHTLTDTNIRVLDAVTDYISKHSPIGNDR